MNTVKHDRAKIGEWASDSIDGWWAFLYVGGNINCAEMVCREACFPSGLCVTIEKVDYIFAGGTEEGVRIGFIQFYRRQFLLRLNDR